MMENSPINYLPDGYPVLFDQQAKVAIDDTLSWEEIVKRETFLPEYERKVLTIIEKRLGYIPAQSITILYEPEIRLYYHRYLIGDIDLDGLYFRTDEMLKLARKWDLKPDNKLFDRPDICRQFRENYLPYLQLAYTRISQHLGYEPDPQCSLAAEIWLAQVIAKDTIYLPKSITPYDYRAMTSVRYREILLTDGEKAANESPLLALHPID